MMNKAKERGSGKERLELCYLILFSILIAASAPLFQPQDFFLLTHLFIYLMRPSLTNFAQAGFKLLSLLVLPTSSRFYRYLPPCSVTPSFLTLSKYTTQNLKAFLGQFLNHQPRFGWSSSGILFFFFSLHSMDSLHVSSFFFFFFM